MLDYLKIKVISEILAKLYADTWKYVEGEKTYRNEEIEPDRPALVELRRQICFTLLHIDTNVFNADLSALKTFVHEIGEQYFHVSGNIRTGTWGVRLSYVDDIFTILDWNCPVCLGWEYHFENGFTQKPETARITRIEYTIYGPVYHIEPRDTRINAWDISYTWSSVRYGSEQDFIRELAPAMG